MSWTLHTGDCFDVLETLDAESVDACVTDPPYGISFMGREWDTFAPSAVEKMRKPKAFASDHANPNLRGRAGWAGSAAVEYDRSADASRKFQAWTQEWAQAVLRVLKPGAHAVVCASPRMAHRVTCGLEDAGFEIRDVLCWLYGSGFPKSRNLGDGRGTALRPAHEPIILARKPCGGTVRACLEQNGTGALNIDACRLATEHPGDPGRWPPNVAMDEAAAAALDAEVGERKSGSAPTRRYSDICPSRFFYVAKASREERERGCEDLPLRTAGKVTGGRQEGSAGLNSPRAGAGRTSGARNHHPTCKPLALMRWLVRLITPPGGLVLDPFVGSGTTGIACVQEQRRFVGIEREAEYVQIAEARIAAAAERFETGGPLFTATAERQADLTVIQPADDGTGTLRDCGYSSWIEPASGDSKEGGR